MSSALSQPTYADLMATITSLHAKLESSESEIASLKVKLSFLKGAWKQHQAGAQAYAEARFLRWQEEAGAWRQRASCAELEVLSLRKLIDTGRQSHAAACAAMRDNPTLTDAAD